MATRPPAAELELAQDSGVFHIEAHGINPIPTSARHGHPRALFWTWFGGAYNYVAIAAGALPVLFGLSLWQALLAVIVGNVLGAIVFGLCAIYGPRTGTATIVNTRAAFGLKGNTVAAAISFISVASWVAVNSVLASLALFQLLNVAGVVPSTLMQVLLVALVLAAQGLIAMYGHAAVMALERLFAVASGILLTGVLVFVLPHISWLAPATTPLAGSTLLTTWLLALGAMFAGPLGWSNYAADYARYLPENTDVHKVALWSGLGMGVANVLGCGIGALLATLVDMSDPLAHIPAIVPMWYLVLFLAAVLWGAVANNALNLYTAGLGLLALHVRAPRWVAVLLIELGAGVLTYIAVFGYNFMTLYAQWLLLSLSFLSPWVAILLVDYWLRRGVYAPAALHTWGQGIYWYRNGVNWRALGIYVLGITTSLGFSNSTVWASPLAVTYLGGADLSLFVGLLLTGGLYFVLEGPSIRAMRAAAGERTELAKASAS